ncbi:Uncharacterised protein [Chlamydia trachomatis]|nr:hypothetical protein HMPREF9215_0697 [Lactobacillus iners SPIN 2503V10-D]EFQ50190.1 hypothetical protein HMPREF9218_0955 [Lactobacillus iners LEAF 2062A-h1]CQB88147.1 Uncharacterised protein [Chlamydia trachomatis]
MPKSTYMYWQKRLDRENPDKEIEDKILEIRETIMVIAEWLEN